MFEDRTTENLKKETLAEIEPATGVSSMAAATPTPRWAPCARR